MDCESGQKVRESSDSVKYTEILQNIRSLTKSIKIKKTEKPPNDTLRINTQDSSIELIALKD